MTDDLNKQWVGKSVRRGSCPDVGVVESVVLCLDRTNKPWIGLRVVGEDWVNVWPATECYVVEVLPCTPEVCAE